MDHNICINQNSFPAKDNIEGKKLFDDAIQGILELQSGQDRFTFYLDSNDGCLYDFEISEDYTIDKYLDEHNDQDLKLFLCEVEDKTPAIDSLSEEQFDDITAFSFYIAKHPAQPHPDVYGLCWALSAYLFSIASSDTWQSEQIEICRCDENGKYVEEPLTLRNISSVDHGISHYKAIHERSIEEVASPHIITGSLSSWYLAQSSENKVRIIDKIELAKSRDFNGGEPLFKNLTNANGLREIRFSAHSGGAIRILFKHKENGTHALLNGFIKKSDGDGYQEAIDEANKLFSHID
ncbi:type II toxin-antitoxin system RelE/ParE family toxin [Vibrio jasicida]|uniref:type II toxin-antitoxin system RelE/ParE family toxin n=1 Tax=Vibrio jasicida TaxID=766224 RepID=UPI0040698E15